MGDVLGFKYSKSVWHEADTARPDSDMAHVENAIDALLRAIPENRGMGPGWHLNIFPKRGGGVLNDRAVGVSVIGLHHVAIRILGIRLSRSLETAAELEATAYRLSARDPSRHDERLRILFFAWDGIEMCDGYSWLLA